MFLSDETTKVNFRIVRFNVLPQKSTSNVEMCLWIVKCLWITDISDLWLQMKVMTTLSDTYED